MVKIGIIGTGRIGSTLGKLWSAQQYEVMFGSREAARAEALAQEIGRNTQGKTITETVLWADVVVLAIPWYAFTDVEREIVELIGRKIVIDCMNPLKSTGSLAIGHKWSAGEEVAKSLPTARVVKAFNHIYWSLLETPDFNGEAASLLYCGDDMEAKEIVATLGKILGFDAIDAGPLRSARLLEPLAVLWIQMAFNIHHTTDFAFKVMWRNSAE